MKLIEKNDKSIEFCVAEFRLNVRNNWWFNEKWVICNFAPIKIWILIEVFIFNLNINQTESRLSVTLQTLCYFVFLAFNRTLDFQQIERWTEKWKTRTHIKMHVYNIFICVFYSVMCCCVPHSHSRNFYLHRIFFDNIFQPSRACNHYHLYYQNWRNFQKLWKCFLIEYVILFWIEPKADTKLFLSTKQ